MRRFAPVALLAVLSPASALAQPAPAAQAPAAAARRPRPPLRRPRSRRRPPRPPRVGPRPGPRRSSRSPARPTGTSSTGAIGRAATRSPRSTSTCRSAPATASAGRGRCARAGTSTSSSPTPTRRRPIREPRMSDPTLDLWFLGIPALGDFRFAIAGGLPLPRVAGVPRQHPHRAAARHRPGRLGHRGARRRDRRHRPGGLLAPLLPVHARPRARGGAVPLPRAPRQGRVEPALGTINNQLNGRTSSSTTSSRGRSSSRRAGASGARASRTP